MLQVDRWSRPSSGTTVLPLDLAIVGPSTGFGEPLIQCASNSHTSIVTSPRPDHCDGTYDANCDPSRAYTNISAIISAAGKTDLLNYMNTYWKDYQGTTYPHTLPQPP